MRKREAEYQYLCGGIQPVFMQDIEENEDQEAAYCYDCGGIQPDFLPEAEKERRKKHDRCNFR
ncbi:MAG: hypothetical protein IKW50_04925 [Oscillospiraceae bacterium]|nr:hypothetical protein [Oscillospiraceae bacterium]